MVRRAPDFVVYDVAGQLQALRMQRCERRRYRAGQGQPVRGAQGEATRLTLLLPSSPGSWNGGPASRPENRPHEVNASDRVAHRLLYRSLRPTHHAVFELILIVLREVAPLGCLRS